MFQFRKSGKGRIGSGVGVGLRVSCLSVLEVKSIVGVGLGVEVGICIVAIEGVGV